MFRHVSKTVTYRSGELDGNLRHADKSPVEVLDRLGSILGRLVTDIAYPSLGKESGVCDGVSPKMFLKVVLIHSRRKTSHKDAGRLFFCSHDDGSRRGITVGLMWSYKIKNTRIRC